MMHPRVSLHQVAFLDQSTTTFVEHCRRFGIAKMTLVTPKLMVTGGDQEALDALAPGGPAVRTVNHPLTACLDGDTDAATESLLAAIDLAARLDASLIYLLTGGRGSLSWEQAAERFARTVEPCRDAAARSGITLLVENASAFNADVHIAHTLTDTIALAEIAGIGVCIDVHGCWVEAGLRRLIERAMPLTGLIQVSDYVLGDRVAPCRAVPGDGAIPLHRIIGDALDAGYRGVFDLELVGPRIREEGAPAATVRAAQRLSQILESLGG